MVDLALRTKTTVLNVVVTGKSISPDCTGTYAVVGQANGQLAYARGDGL